jgi:2-hydroxy-3-keto-5-methylthiopentenyl-1-phosphate phosphatase
LTTRILVTDFDGTITDRDFYLLVARQYMPRSAPDYWTLYSRGMLTHFQAMQRFYSHTPADEAALGRLLDETAPDPLLRQSVERLKAAGWQVRIASAGSSWYIERLLARAGVTGVEIHASPGTIEPERGLVLRLPEGSPYLSRESGIDKEAVVREALSRADVVAFAGDGPPDVGPALMVAPEMRFARGWLAGELHRRGEEFRLFRRWSDISAELLRAG